MLQAQECEHVWKPFGGSGPRAQNGPHSTSPGTAAWFLWWSVSCDWNHHAPAREEPEKGKEEHQSTPGVTMCDDAGKSSVQASTQKVATSSGTEGRRRMRAVRSWSRGGMSSESGGPVTGRGKEEMYAGQHDGHVPRYLEERILLQTSQTPTREGGHRPSSVPSGSQSGSRSDPSWRRTNPIHGQ